jgi:hypothetical protein
VRERRREVEEKRKKSRGNCDRDDPSSVVAARRRLNVKGRRCLYSSICTPYLYLSLQQEGPV